MKYLLTALMLLTGVCCMAKDELLTAPPRAAITQMKTPVIDGIVQEDELKYTTGMYGFCMLRPSLEMMTLLPADARFNIGTDGKLLYLSVQCEVGPDGILERARAGRGGQRAFMDDSMEFVFVPNPREKIPDIYHIITNNKGSYMTAARKNNANAAWEPAFKFKGRVKDGVWSYEAAFPLSAFGIEELKEGQEIGVRICRNWRRMSKEYGGDWGIQTAWSQIRGAFFESDSIPIVVYRKSVPVVRFLSLKKEIRGNEPDLRVSLFNPTAETMKLKTAYLHRPSTSQSIANEEQIALKPGETKIMQLPTAQITDGEVITTGFQVASGDGEKIYYRRAFKWSLERPEVFAAPDVGEKDKIALKYAYYPESDGLFLQLDFSAVEVGKVKKITAVVTDKAGRKIAETTLPAVRKKLCETLWKLPSLKKITQQTNPSGEYTVAVTVDGIENAKIVRNFERKVFPWEGNQLGKSDRLIPPFTPVKVNGNTVSTLLRDHLLSDMGLWRQVTADGADLLKEDGMRLEAVVNGKTYSAQGKGLRFTKRSDTNVKAEAEWQAGPLKGKAFCDFDFDGMMKYDLMLESCRGKVDSLKLIIPLDEANAYLFHACTDGLRFNYGGATPKGEGRVWDSTKAARMDLQSSYVPYLWLGTEKRGFSVFGENDRGWSIAENIPAQELIRKKDGAMYLVLNLFAKPVELKNRRRIELGFQAMPVKPMRKDWRKCAIWGVPEKAKPYLNYYMSFIGSALCRGGVSSSDDLAPRDNDLSLWETYAQVRRTKQIPAGYLDKWCAGYKNKERLKSYRAEINYGLYLMKGAPAGSVTFYTNARGIRTDIPETRTFQDNWLREEFQGNRIPGYGSSRSYSVEPTESFRDYAVTWYKNMIATGACDNIYWDDIFLASNFDRSGQTAAYVMEDGRLQPGVGLFNMRELFRRTALMQVGMGREPFNMVHMTNTAIAPLLSFAQQNLDWEDNLGTNPFQQRYTKEYIRAVSIGGQFGNLPGALGLVTNQGDRNLIEWCLRTGAGVTLTHEVFWTKGGAAKDYWNNMIEMLKFGYGGDEVHVWNYWEKEYPVRIAGGSNSSIFLVKGKEAILIVCDYENGGEFKVTFDEKKLGWNGIAEAVDGESGKALKVTDGTIAFQLRKYDFITIRIKAK